MTAKIIVSKDNKPVQQFVLTNESTSIGRKPENDISIKDPAVSGSHATVQLVAGNYLIQDLGSTNGLHIRGRRFKQQVLKTGDIISIGVHELKFVIQQGKATDGSPPKAKPNARAKDESKPVDETELPVDRQKAKPGSAGAVPVLIVLNGADKDKLIKLNEALTTIGEPGVQVAAISSRPQGHFIIHVDGGKDNETPVVNGEPTGFKSRKLESGDRIQVAGIEMEYLAP